MPLLRSRLIAATLTLTCATFAINAFAQTPAAAKPATSQPAAKPAAKASPKATAKPATRKPKGPAFVPETTINWRGDIVSARGYTNDLVKDFKTEKKGLLNLQTFSTISGIDAVIDGSADVAGVARPMYEKRDGEKTLVFQPVALDAIVPVVHPRNPVTSISLAHLRQIYLGRIKNWKDIGGNDVPINLYSVAAPLDGVEYSFRQLLYKRGDQKVGVPRLYLNTSKLEEGITLDPAGLGLSTLSSSYANKGMKMLAVEGIQASTSSIANGSYPLFTTLYIVHRSESPNQARINEFVLFLDSPPAHAAMRRHQLVPYADAGDVY
ncbi:MAG: substrate-binding domain-containing protein, partial [Dokdonella sp.]